MRCCNLFLQIIVCTQWKKYNNVRLWEIFLANQTIKRGKAEGRILCLSLRILRVYWPLTRIRPQLYCVIYLPKLKFMKLKNGLRKTVQQILTFMVLNAFNNTFNAPFPFSHILKQREYKSGRTNSMSSFRWKGYFLKLWAQKSDYSWNVFVILVI